jgi:hypothetical protein
MGERLSVWLILHDRNRELSERPAPNSDPSKRRQLQTRYKQWTYLWKRSGGYYHRRQFKTCTN